jgi:hypothetical protein
MFTPSIVYHDIQILYNVKIKTNNFCLNKIKSTLLFQFQILTNDKQNHITKSDIFKISIFLKIKIITPLLRNSTCPLADYSSVDVIASSNNLHAASISSKVMVNGGAIRIQ